MFFVVLDVYRLVKLTEHRQAPSAGSSGKGWGFSFYIGPMVKFMPYPMVKPAIPGKRSIFTFSFSGLSDNNSLPAYAPGMGDLKYNFYAMVSRYRGCYRCSGYVCSEFCGEIYFPQMKEIWLI